MGLAPAPAPTISGAMPGTVSADPSIVIDAAGNQVATNGTAGANAAAARVYRMAQFAGLPFSLGAVLAAYKAKPMTPVAIAIAAPALQYFLKNRLYINQAVLGAAGIIGGYYIIKGGKK